MRRNRVNMELWINKTGKLHITIVVKKNMNVIKVEIGIHKEIIAAGNKKITTKLIKEMSH